MRIQPSQKLIPLSLTRKEDKGKDSLLPQEPTSLIPQDKRQGKGFIDKDTTPLVFLIPMKT